MPSTRDLDLVDALFQLSFHLQAALARIAAKHDLSLIQVRLLGILRDREPGMLALARHLELEKSSLSGLVDRAGKRGLVERIPSPDDGRAAHVRLTVQGRKLALLVQDQVSAEVVRLAGGLSRPDRVRLARLAARVVSGAAPRAAG